MKQVLAGLIEGAREVSAHDDVYDLEPSHSAQHPRVRRIKKPHLVHPVFAEFMRSPRLLAVLSALLGPSGVRLHGSKLNLKAPEIGSPVEWHQDWAFYPHTNDDILAVGVLLDNATAENGPLIVVPGSHRGPTFDHHGPDGHFFGAMDPVRDRLDYASAPQLIEGREIQPSKASIPSLAMLFNRRASADDPPPTRWFGRFPGRPRGNAVLASRLGVVGRGRRDRPGKLPPHRADSRSSALARRLNSIAKLGILALLG